MSCITMVTSNVLYSHAIYCKHAWSQCNGSWQYYIAGDCNSRVLMISTVGQNYVPLQLVRYGCKSIHVHIHT